MLNAEVKVKCNDLARPQMSKNCPVQNKPNTFKYRNKTFPNKHFKMTLENTRFSHVFTYTFKILTKIIRIRLIIIFLFIYKIAKLTPKVKKKIT